MESQEHSRTPSPIIVEVEVHATQSEIRASNTPTVHLEMQRMSLERSRTSVQPAESIVARQRLEDEIVSLNPISKRSSPPYIKDTDIEMCVMRSELRISDIPTVSVPLERQLIRKRSEVNMSIRMQGQPSVSEQFSDAEYESVEEVDLGGREPSREHTVFQNITHSLSNAWSVMRRRLTSRTQSRISQQTVNVRKSNLPPINLFMLCIICFRDEKIEPLIVQCACLTTTNLVHRSCLIQRIKLTKIKICPVCKEKYRVESTGIGKWITDKLGHLYICFTIGIVITATIALGLKFGLDFPSYKK